MLAESYTLRPGDPAPPFGGLPGIDGKTYSLDEFADAKALLVVFSCNHCPYVQAYEGRMQDVYDAYGDKGMAMVAINSNDADEYPEDSFDAMKSRAQQQGLTFPYVRDESQQVAEAYGAACTPHVMIFDADRKLAYQGRYDGEKDDPEKGNAQDVRDALDAILADQAPKTPQTRAFGCSIKWGPAHFERVKG
jgi:peroxiredoxin